MIATAPIGAIAKEIEARPDERKRIRFATDPYQSGAISQQRLDAKALLRTCRRLGRAKVVAARDCHDKAINSKTINLKAASIVASSRRHWELFAWDETLAFDVH